MNIKTLGFIMVFLAIQPSPPAEACTLLRTAKATVKILKVYYVRENGIYIQKTIDIAATDSDVDVNVFQGDLGGCSNMSQLLRRDNLVINGVPQSITIVGTIQNFDSPISKSFNVSYWIAEATTTTVPDGASGESGTASSDLSTKKVEVFFSAAAGPQGPQATMHAESLWIEVWFVDDVEK